MPHTCVRSLFDLLHLNAYLMREAIEEFDEDSASERVLGGSKNSFKFLLGHVLWSRVQIAELLGRPQAYSWLPAFAGGQAHTSGTEYPTLRELARAYGVVADTLTAALDEATDEELMQPTAQALGEQESTVRGAISFWVWQDCYHLGQVGSILTTLGLTDLKTLHYRRKLRLEAEAPSAGRD